MVSRATFVILALATALGLAGCGTLCNLPKESGVTVWDETPHDRIYGGVLRDVASGTRCLHETVAADCKDGRLDNLVAGSYWLLVDLPLSAVGDTLTLPLTIPASLPAPYKSSGPEQWWIAQPECGPGVHDSAHSSSKETARGALIPQDEN
jgi:uncharacterized protein YceK